MIENRKPPPTVSLEWFEMSNALQVGGHRLIEQHRQHDASVTSFNSTLSPNKWQVNIEGAMGELAAAKYLRTYWEGSINKHADADVGGFIEVRTCSYDNGWLWVWPKDADDRLVVLVCGRSPTFKVVGWIKAGDAKRGDWWQHDGAPNNRKRAKCWFVPPEELTDARYLAHQLHTLRFIHDGKKKGGQ